MNSLERTVTAFAVLAIAILSACLSGPGWAQPANPCPSGQTLCRSEGGVLLCGNCSDPDSTYILMRAASDPDSTATVTLLSATGKGVSGISSALNLAGPAAMGAMLEAAVHSSTAQLADIQLQAGGEGKWLVSSRPMGSGPAQKAMFRVMSGRTSLASFSGTSAVAQVAAFPSHFSVATTKTGTTMTWAFKEPVDIGMGESAAAIGALHRGTALSVTVPNGSASGLSRLNLNHRGTGAIKFANPKATPISMPKTMPNQP